MGGQKSVRYYLNGPYESVRERELSKVQIIQTQHSQKMNSDNLKQKQIAFAAHVIICNLMLLLLLLSFDNFCEDEQFFVNTTVAEVVVAEEAVEAVVAVILDHAGAKRAVGIVATKFFTAPLQKKKITSIDEFFRDLSLVYTRRLSLCFPHCVAFLKSLPWLAN